MGIVGVEYRRFLCDLDHDALHFGELFEGVDALESQMVGAYVEDRADFAFSVAQPPSQDAAARGLEDSGVHAGIAQHHAR